MSTLIQISVTGGGIPVISGDSGEMFIQRRHKPPYSFLVGIPIWENDQLNGQGETTSITFEFFIW